VLETFGEAVYLDPTMLSAVDYKTIHVEVASFMWFYDAGAWVPMT